MKVGDLDVARIGLGSNRLTRTRDNAGLIRAAVAAGVQMIDTAHSYTGGQSEETIGEALSPIPADVVVATKGGFARGTGRPETLRDEIEQSLRRLKTTSIALYYLHRVDPETPIEVSLGTIKEYQERGQVRHIGISEVGIELIERARKVVPIAAIQNHYNVVERRYDAVVDYCTREGIAFVPFFPLRARASGELLDVARRHRATPEQVMLAWLLRRSPVMLPIPGTLSIEHLKENLAAANIELTDAEFRALR
jgi:pyridoxine 4-dehydrogenase